MQRSRSQRRVGEIVEAADTGISVLIFTVEHLFRVWSAPAISATAHPPPGGCAGCSPRWR